MKHIYTIFQQISIREEVKKIIPKVYGYLIIIIVNDIFKIEKQTTGHVLKTSLIVLEILCSYVYKY